MRPRKVLVLYCANEDRRSELRFLLTLKGWRVVEMGELGAGADGELGAGADGALVVGNPLSPMVVDVARHLVEDYGIHALVEAPQPEWQYYPLGAIFVIPNNLPDMIRLLRVATRESRKKQAGRVGNLDCQLRNCEVGC